MRRLLKVDCCKSAVFCKVCHVNVSFGDEGLLHVSRLIVGWTVNRGLVFANDSST